MLVSEPVGQTVSLPTSEVRQAGVCGAVCVSVCVLLHVGGDAFSGLESCRRPFGSLCVQKGRENTTHTNTRMHTRTHANTLYCLHPGGQILLQNSQICRTVCLLASDVRSVATMLNTKLFSKMDFVTDKIRLVLADLRGFAYG